MTDTEQRSAVTKFYNEWRGIGDEKSDFRRFQNINYTAGLHGFKKKNTRSVIVAVSYIMFERDFKAI